MRRTLAVIGLGLLGSYGFFIEPQWVEETHHQIGVRGPGISSVRVAQVSDLHLESFGGYEASLAARLREAKPDLVVISGDAIDREEGLAPLKKFLEATSDLERIAVLGNWEYWSGVGLAELRRVYESNGVRLLVNESETYPVRGVRLQVTGLDDFTAGKPFHAIGPRSDAADVAIVVQHSPGMFETLNDPGRMVDADLCLSGHTHGGQLSLFGWAVWTPPGSGTFTAGMYSTQGCPLYVSRGLGTSLIPARLGARPEIAVFDIGRAVR